MKKVRSEFGAHGHWLRQIWREGNLAVYGRSLTKEHLPHELELAVIRVRGTVTMPSGLVVETHETYPSDSQWGTYAWSFPVRHKAWVMNLAASCSRDLEGLGAFIRQALTDYKETEEFKKIESRFEEDRKAGVR